jgi:hypothetical protein
MKNINLRTIRIDGGTQSRVELNAAALADYTQALRDGQELPPIVVFFDGADNWLADGFHRYHAYREDKRASIPADVHKGTVRDAILFSVGANGAHGLRRTNDDKRKSVMTLLADDVWSNWSDREIAKACGVTQPFVSSIRKPVEVKTVIACPQVTSQVKPKKEAPMWPHVGQEPEPERNGPSEDEIRAAEESAAEDLAAAQALLAANDPLAQLATENKRLKALCKSLELRITGLIGEKDAAVRSAKSWQRKYEQAQKLAA